MTLIQLSIPFLNSKVIFNSCFQAKHNKQNEKFPKILFHFSSSHDTFKIKQLQRLLDDAGTTLLMEESKSETRSAHTSTVEWMASPFTEDVKN